MLPTCPACKQSVLDDDATECPFCGANMKTGKVSGKTPAPQSKAPAKAPAAAAKSAPKPAPSASKPTSSRKSMLDDDDDDPFGDNDDDDPFAAATKEGAASKANAIAVSPKKTKTHVVELKCPMCDTVGFVPEKSGGKDVKCCNPKCTVPVFMAPKNLAPPVQTAAAKPAAASKGPSKKPLILAIAGGVAFVAVVGTVVFFWDSMFGKPEPKQFSFKEAAEKLKLERAAAGLPPVDPSTLNANATEANSAEKVADGVPAEEKLDIPYLLQVMEDRSLEEKLVNKKYCRQRTAMGHALMGNVEGMRSQFQSLDQIESALQHFKIPAFLTLGWNQLAKGDKAGAAKTADEALTATANVGKGSRDTQEAIIGLAAFLAATGKADAARQLLSEHFRTDASTPLVVATALAWHRHDYDLTKTLPGNNSNPYRAWPELGVTLILATEGLWAEAQQWADAVPTVEAKTDCLIAWADAKTHDALAKKQPVDSAVEVIGEKLMPGGNVQLLSQLALTQAQAGNQSDAERLVAAAVEALKAIPVPEMARCDGFKEVLDWKAPDPIPLRQAAIGATSLGLAQAKLKKVDEGMASVVEGLKFARGIAPSPAAVATVKEEADGLGLDGLREKVRMLLNLRGRDEALRKTRELQNKLDQLQELSHSRFHLQEVMLQSAAEAGLAKQVWQEALSLSDRTDPHEQEPYLSGTLPTRLLHHFNANGMSTEAAEVSSRVDQGESPTDEVLELQQVVEAAVKAHNFADAIAAFNQRKLTGASEQAALRGFIEAAKREGQAVPTLQLADSMDTKNYNQFVKLEALRLLAAYGARQGEFLKVRDVLQGQRLSSLEKISGYLGLIEGYLTRQRLQAAAAPPPEKEAAAKADAK